MIIWSTVGMDQSEAGSHLTQMACFTDEQELSWTDKWPVFRGHPVLDKKTHASRQNTRKLGKLLTCYRSATKIQETQTNTDTHLIV